MDQALRPRSVGEILDSAFGLYRRHFTVLVGIGLVLFVPLIALLWIVPPLAVSLNIFLIPLHAGALIFALASGAWDAEPTVGGSLLRALKRYPVLAFLWALYAVAKFFAMLMLLVPFLFLVPLVFAWKHVLLLEPRQALMRRTLRLSEGALGKALAVVFVSWLVSTLPGLALGVGNALTAPQPTGDVFGDLGWMFTTSALAYQTLGFLVQALMVPYLYAATTMLYVDQRARKDGIGVERSADSLERALEA